MSRQSTGVQARLFEGGDFHFVTKRNSSSKRGRPPSSFDGITLRELGISRLNTWKWMRLASIPEEQFEALLTASARAGKPVALDGILRATGKLSPDRPRPPERARVEALEHLEFAMAHCARLYRELLETGSESELADAKETATALMRASDVLSACGGPG